jgi:uncharacterized protein (DUF924 family)
MIPESAETVLGEILRLDVLPRQIGIQPARADHAEALSLATALVASGRDKNLLPHLRAFVFLPLLHSEELIDRERAVALFAGLRRETQQNVFEQAYGTAVAQRDALLEQLMLPPRGDRSP